MTAEIEKAIDPLASHRPSYGDLFVGEQAADGMEYSYGVRDTVVCEVVKIPSNVT